MGTEPDVLYIIKIHFFTKSTILNELLIATLHVITTLGLYRLLPKMIILEMHPKGMNKCHI